MTLALFTIAWALSTAGCLSCKPEGTPAPAASVSAASATASATAIPSATDDEGPSAPPRPPSACVPLREVMSHQGTYKQWSKSFQVSPPPEKRPLPKLRTTAEFPHFPGGRLAVVRSGDIVVTDFTLGRESAIPGGGRDGSPAWSHAGTYLAFVREAHGVNRVYLSRPGKGAPFRVSTRSSNGPIRVVFSADERWLAFATPSDGVILHDLQTGVERPLPSSERADNGPVFDPGSSRLAYMIGDQAVVVDAETGNERRYDPVGFQEVQSIAMAPGALFIAGSPQGGEPFRQTSVQRLDLDSGKATHSFVPGFTAGAWAEIFAAPAGTRMAIAVNSRPFVETKDANGVVSYGVGDWIRRSIFFRDTRTDAEHQVGEDFPQPLFSTDSPAWAPDGRHLAFKASLWKEWQDSEPEAEAIVVVDTDHLEGDPAYVTCGHDPAWGK